MNLTRRLTAGAFAAALPLSLAACGSDAGDSKAGRSAMNVVTSFYPLQFAAEQIGGDKVHVSSLTKPGQEPHDIDPSPRQIGSIADADLTVYVKGFQSNVDAAVEATAKKNTALDVAPAADMNLRLAATANVGEQEPSDEGHEHGSDTDPHFWLDPMRYKRVVEAMGARMAQADPPNKALYESNTRALSQKLDALNGEYRSGLATCANKTLVTGHAAFGYLANRYGLTQVGVTGVSPDAEPTPKRLQAVAAFVKSHHVTTIYSETLVSPKTAETVAHETGANVAVLDPIEGLTSASKGTNYLEVMTSNLATLKQGQNCT